MILSDTSIKRPIFISMIMVALALFGAIAYKNLGVDLFPKVDFPVITILSSLPGADPETIEKSVSEVIEDSVSTINSIKHLVSTSAEGFSQVAIEFDLDKNIDIAYQEVQAKLGSIRKLLPEDLKDIVVEKFDIDSTPIMAIVVSGNLPIQKISEIVDKQIKDRLQQLEGVGQINTVGKQERNIWINLDPLKLYGLNITIQDVINALKEQHIEFPGGRISTEANELMVKTKAEFAHPDQLKEIVIAYHNGYPIKIADVGQVVDGLEEQRTIARLNDKTAVALLVRRQSGTNTVNVAHAIKETIKQIQKDLASEGVNIEIAQDLSVFIEHSIEEIQFHLVFGGLLAVIIVFLFLRNFRITIISALAIPISTISTFILLRYLDFTLNSMTMLALSLSIGILIDDAIVVVENIYRHFKSGKSSENAAKEGAQEIGLAAFAITMSIVAVFLPVALMKGIVGRFFFQFGMTVTFAVLISLFVAFTLTPMLSAKFLKIQEKKGRFSLFMEKTLSQLDHGYFRLLSKALRYRKSTLTIAFFLLLTSFYFSKHIKSEFIPLEDRNEFFIKIKAPLDSSLSYTEKIIEKIGKEVRSEPWVNYTFSTIGSDSFNKVNEAIIYVKMPPKDQRKISQAEAMKEMRQKLIAYDKLKISVEPVPAVSGGGRRFAALQVDVRGNELENIEHIADGIIKKMEDSIGYVDVDMSYEKGKPEVEVVIKRDQATAIGVSPATIAQSIKPLIGGLDVSKFRAEGNLYNISVRLLPDFRAKSHDLFNLSVRNNKGDLVKLHNLVELHERKGPVRIDRYNRSKIISIYSNLQEGKKVLGEAIDELTAYFNALSLPSGYSIRFGGNAESMKESFENLLFALFLAVIVVYMVLASQFESFIQPFIIMLSLPFSLIGALGILVISQMTLSIFTIIGIIMLMGLVTKNAILLIDYTNTLRARDGLSKEDAILKAGPTRLHPILMTTLAMIFGMLPIAASHGPGSETRAPMALAIIGGLITSMFLTLVIVPVVYTLTEDTIASVKNWFTKRKAIRFQEPDTSVDIA